jgi:formate C-acetyltransferase
LKLLDKSKFNSPFAILNSPFPSYPIGGDGLKRRNIFIILGGVFACLSLCAVFYTGRAVLTGSWGLSFRQEGLPPVGSAGAPQLARYDAAIKRIASESPVRICPDEKISGAATLGMAVRHYIPATYNGKSVSYGMSHLTADFETVVKCGVNYVKDKALKAYSEYKGTESEEFIKSCLNCIEAFEIWHSRYLDALSNMPEYKANYENLKRVPFEPATSFYEAVQSIWFAFAFMRLCGNWPGIGRIDHLLGDYLKKDLKNGSITLDEAREILAHFFIKGSEWVNGQYIGS